MENGIVMDIDKVQLSKTIRELANLDYETLKQKTSLINQSKAQYTKSKMNRIDEDFIVHTAGELLRIEVKRAKDLFLRNFVNENIDNQFNYSIQNRKGKVIIIIEKNSINENNFRQLVKLMYIHTLI